MTKEIIKVIGGVVLFLVLLDLIILFGALAQIAIEGKTGYWNSFWLTQARFLISFLN